MQDEKFGLRFVVAEVQLAHSPELLERLVDVPYSEALAGVVGHSALALALQLDLGGEVLVIFLWTAYEKEEEKVKSISGRGNCCRTLLILPFLD